MPSAPQSRYSFLRRFQRERSSPARFAERWSRGRWHSAPHLEILSSKLAAAVAEGNQRIMVWMPPRHGKSEFTSVYFPAWFLDRYPGRFVLLCSYGHKFARKWGRRVRSLFKRPAALTRAALSSEIYSADEWETTLGGGMKTAGVGGDITGRGAHLALVDDPVKNAADAWSETIRDAQWDWWQSTLYTRLEPGASVVIVQTRWHEDDLSGRILRESDEAWDVIRIPAIAEEEEDPLGRKPGEALWPDRYSAEDLDRIRRNVGTWVWEALYQQRPRPGTGAIWKQAWFSYWDPHPERPFTLVDDDGRELTWMGEGVRRTMTVDLAMSEKQTADFTVIAVWAEAWPHRYLLDLIVARMEAPEILRRIKRAWDKHKVDKVRLEAVQGQAYIGQILRADGFAIEEVRPDRDKRARYMAASVSWERRHVHFPRHAPYLGELERQLLSVPAAPHDDIADAVSMIVLDSSGAPLDPPEILEEEPFPEPMDGLGLSEPSWDAW